MPALPSARFHTTVAHLRQLPREGLPEVAFIGRSNAGKSSAINVLCRRRRLAFSSSTPGRTQALNYYAIGRETEPPEGFLVDMPGYGYAQAPGEIRKAWDALAGNYLRDRPPLRAAVLMVDIRRLLTDLDRRMLAWLPPALPLLILLTKCDKFGTAQQNAARRAVLTELTEQHGRPQAQVVLFSAENRKGVEEARALIEQWFADAATDAAAADTPDTPTDLPPQEAPPDEPR